MKNRFIVFISLFLILSSDCALCSNILNQEEPDFKNITTIRQFNNPRALEIAKKYKKVLIVYNINCILKETKAGPELLDKNIPHILKNMQTTLIKNNVNTKFILMIPEPTIEHADFLTRKKLDHLQVDNRLFRGILYSYKQKNKWRSSFGEEYNDEPSEGHLLREYLKINPKKFGLVCYTGAEQSKLEFVTLACELTKIPRIIYLYKKEFLGRDLKTNPEQQNSEPSQPTGIPGKDGDDTTTSILKSIEERRVRDIMKLSLAEFNSLKDQPKENPRTIEDKRMQKAIVSSLADLLTPKSPKKPQKKNKARAQSLEKTLKALFKHQKKMDAMPRDSLEGQKKENYKLEYTVLLKSIKDIITQLQNINKPQKPKKTPKKEEKKPYIDQKKDEPLYGIEKRQLQEAINLSRAIYNSLTQSSETILETLKDLSKHKKQLEQQITMMGGNLLKIQNYSPTLTEEEEINENIAIFKTQIETIKQEIQRIENEKKNKMQPIFTNTYGHELEEEIRKLYEKLKNINAEIELLSRESKTLQQTQKKLTRAIKTIPSESTYFLITTGYQMFKKTDTQINTHLTKIQKMKQERRKIETEISKKNQMLLEKAREARKKKEEQETESEGESDEESEGKGEEKIEWEKTDSDESENEGEDGEASGEEEGEDSYFEDED